MAERAPGENEPIGHVSTYRLNVAGASEPGTPFVVEPFANFGSSEPWVARTMLGIQEIVGATPWSADQNVSEAIGEVFLALSEAFADLLALRKLELEEGVPVTDRQRSYSAFYVHLWRAYKDRFQNLVPPALGYKIGFLWSSDKDFEKISLKFLKRHPEISPQVIEMMRDERESWQKPLAHFRNNHLEHKKALDPEFVEPFFTLPVAELAFENVWEAIEDMTIQLLLPSLPPGVHLVELPTEERDPVIPKRFRFAVEGLPSTG